MGLVRRVARESAQEPFVAACLDVRNSLVSAADRTSRAVTPRTTWRGAFDSHALAPTPGATR